MRKFLLLFASFAPLLLPAQQLLTRFEQSHFTESPPYADIIGWWQRLDQASNKVKLLTMGPTDAGYPLHLAIVSADGDADMASLRRKNKHIILINNGIHPGEPDGIDASMLLARDIATGKTPLPANIVLAIIPVYNIGGCLNRSPNYRIDQNGPVEKGFRGNSQNLDLNRDFIKCDSKEARSFAAIFHLCDPDVFVDNHVSDGADYQHIMTLLTSQHNKLGGAMGDYLDKTFEPALYADMKQQGYDMVPYVNAFGETPESGWPAYWDSPRYSSGYATLWHTFAFVPETHILKTYGQRVKATLALEWSFIRFTSTHGSEIKALRKADEDAAKTQTLFPITWGPDRSQYKEITFKGYEAAHKPSAVSGLPRLYYDRSKPFEKQVKFYNTFQVKTSIAKPVAYIIPQGWWKVIDLLRLNGVAMRPLQHDTLIEVEVYHIDDYKTAAHQYEMHHLNSDVKLSTTRERVHFRKGDCYIPLNQAANRFLMETLEPQAEDSYFAWNYFDAILGQKEGYSHYVFEDKAAEYLQAHPDVKALLEQRRAADTAFANSGPAQLDFVFRHSPYYEPDHMRYPVYRVMTGRP